MDVVADQILKQVKRQQVRYVVLGASAGAIEVLGHLMPALQPTTSIAVIAVVHIPAHRESLLTAIFQNRCALRIVEPDDKQPLEAAHVYFAPPGYHLLVERQRILSLSVDAPVHYSRPSIDVLFESAASALTSEVLGIILTGANRDGAAGLRSIYEHGGLALVQRPGDAEAPTMPQSALDLCPQAHSLSVAQLAELFQGL